MVKNFLSFLRDEEGASMVEYSILIGLITAGAVTIIATMGTRVNTAWSNLQSSWTK